MPPAIRPFVLPLGFTLLSAFALERAVLFIYLAEMGRTALEVSTLQVALFVSIFLAELPTGWIGDRIGRKASVMVGVGLKAFSLLVQSYGGQSYPLLVAAFVIYGIGLSCISGSFTALLFEVARRHQLDHRFARLLAINEFVEASGLALAMAFGPFLKERFEWHWVFNGAALANGLAALIIWPVNDPYDRVKGLKETRVADIQIKRLLAVAFPLALIHASMTPFFMSAQLLLHQTSTNLAYVGGALASVELLSSLSVLFVLPRFPNLKRTWPLMATFPVLLLFTLNPNFTATCLTLLACSVVVGILRVSVQARLNSIITDDRTRASSLSVISFLDTIMISVGYLWVGALQDRTGLRFAVASLAIFPVAALVVRAGTNEPS